MTRSTDLARQAIARHELRGVPLDQAIAWAIRQALCEDAGASLYEPLPRAMAAVVALLQDHGRLSPKRLSRFRGTSTEASRQVLDRMLADRLVVRVRHGTYELAPRWHVHAALVAERWQASMARGGRTSAEALHRRRRQTSETAA